MTRIFVRVNDTQTETFNHAKVNYEHDDLLITDEKDESKFLGGFKQWMYWRYLPDLDSEPDNKVAQQCQSWNFQFDADASTYYIPPKEE